MFIITIRTDKPEAELGLYDNDQQLAYSVWEAHRSLAETIHQRLKELLDKQGKKLSNVDGIVVYKGPGSFTGLRIGISVANALADALQIPIVGEIDDHWLDTALSRLIKNQNDKIVIPNYGAPVKTTMPKK